MKSEDILKQKDVLHQISQASDAIRRKHKLLKLGKDTAEKAMDEMFKPIVTPLKTLIESSGRKVKQENIKEEIKAETKNENSDQQPDNFDSLISDDESFINSNRQHRSTEPLASSSPIKTDHLLKTYIQKLNRNHKEIDFRYGVRKKNKAMFIGNSNIYFNNDEINVQDKVYPMTHGLLELLVKKDPQDSVVTQNDKKHYLDIVERTNMYWKNYKPDTSIFNDLSPKFQNYVVEFLAKRHPNFSKGGGLPSHMIVKKKNRNMDYVYWDDPNELVERLRLLIASQSAGNTSHTNEIISIIEELREAEIIY
ncbi:uncharacterized protein LOC123267455 [Cotesia glomerata]|uniref:uncharacterized protein LOC123267455 n=1 Tax=Cotesia glomerata TaxID=32391 RepID=UPI001D02B4EF|nr:uncharacterized protein LOC123267455 [Cotesia glomerata]